MNNDLVCLIANLGTSDLKLDGEPIKPLREKSKAIFDNYPNYSSHLTTPILSPVLNMIAKNYPDTKLDVVFFLTDQPEVVPQRVSDTIFIADIIKKLWMESGNRPKINKVCKYAIQSNPNLSDSMYKLYDEQFNRRKKIFSKYETIYLSITGGIPACNIALLFNAIIHFGDLCVPVFTNETDTTAISLQINKQIGYAVRNKILEEAIKQYDYALADTLFQEQNKPIAALIARSAEHRMNFDFETAIKILDEVISKDLTSARSLALEMKNEITRAINEDFNALINELYGNMKAYWERKAYLDMIGRVFRFIEAVLRNEVEKMSIHTKAVNDSKNFSKYQESINNIQGLTEYLDKESVYGEKLNYDKPNIPTFLAILEFQIIKDQKDGEKCERLKIIREQCSKLNSLSSLRNKSPLGHGFKGVSLEKIQEEFSEFTFETINYLLITAGIEINNPYSKINEFLLKSIEDY